MATWATPRTARKQHRCQSTGCSVGTIEPGERYIEHRCSPNDPDIGYEIWWRLRECATCASRYGRAELLAVSR
jgi:predicted RNA-binding Zn-ribbon protein involved in translation (DUF1610 family)